MNKEGKNEKTILNEEQLIKLEALASCMTSEQIADYFGIARSTFYDLMNRDEEAARRYKKGRVKIANDIGNIVIKKALSGDLSAAFFYLKTKAGWRETQKIDHSSEDGTMAMPHTIKIIGVDPGDKE